MAVDEKKPEAAAAEATEDANGDQEGVFKGQLISECLFYCWNFRKTNETFDKILLWLDHFLDSREEICQIFRWFTVSHVCSTDWHKKDSSNFKSAAC